MTWVSQVHAKAHILQGQIENMRRLAVESGIDPDAVSAQLYRQIEDLYATEFPLARAMDESDLVFHLEGPALRDHTPRLSLIESVFSNIRQQIFKVANAVADLGEGVSITDKDVELSLSALAPGSLYIGIKAEPPQRADGQINVFGDSDMVVRATREAMRSIGVVSQHLDDGVELQHEVPDDKIRDAAFVAIAKLAPTGKRGIAKVTISSSTDEKQTLSAELTPKVRSELRRQLKGSGAYDAKALSHPNQISLQGEIRELDLDFRRFELRRIVNLADVSVRCVLLPTSEVRLASLAGMRVQIVGLGSIDEGGVPRLVHVEHVVALPTEEIPQTGTLQLTDIPNSNNLLLGKDEPS